MAAASGGQVQAALDAIETKMTAEQAKGYRGARVDPEPNSAYSQETDPTTSPRAKRHGTDFVEIDQFADPDNPRIDSIYDTDGLDAEALAAQDVQVKTDTVPAEATAGTAQTTDLESADAPFDGLVTKVRIKSAAGVTGHATNGRIFTVHNKTKNTTVATWSTLTGAQGSLTTAFQDMVLAAGDECSTGDEYSVVETIAGTGVAHTGCTFELTFNQTD